MRDGRLLSAGVLALALLLPGRARAQQYGAPPLEPGDQIRVQMVQEPTLSGDFTVDASGTISLPLVGRQQVAGVPADQLKSRLQQEYDRQLRNEPAQITFLRRVRVLGAVRDPGLYHVDETMTLGDAIALAGGVLPDGKDGGIRIRRNGEVVRADLDRSSAATALRSGDEIYVPRRGWFVRNASWLVGAAVSAISAAALIATR